MQQGRSVDVGHVQIDRHDVRHQVSDHVNCGSGIAGEADYPEVRPLAESIVQHGLNGSRVIDDDNAQLLG
jgi:hypothetical protein